MWVFIAHICLVKVFDLEIMYCCIGKYHHPIFGPPLALYHAEISVHFLSFKAALAIFIRKNCVWSLKNTLICHKICNFKITTYFKNIIFRMRSKNGASTWIYICLQTNKYAHWVIEWRFNIFVVNVGQYLGPRMKMREAL